jgi:hypothetical protein
MKKVIINLGCGKTRIPGSFGVDSVEIPGTVDVIHNLNETPYPTYYYDKEANDFELVKAEK